MKPYVHCSRGLFLFLLVLGAGSSPHQAAAHPVSDGVKASAAEPFTLGADDVIDISVRDHVEMDRTITILPDGKITVPSLGEFQAAGKTPRALAAEIQVELEKTLNNVSVTVAVKETHSRRARVVGAVKMTGIYDIRSSWRVLDLVVAAGGLSAKPELITGRIFRGGAQVLSFNLLEALRAPDTQANLPLEANDLLLLDEQTPIHRQAQVVGQVNKPSMYDLEPDTTLMGLIAQAGNPTEHAALTRVYVLREGKQIPVNLYPMLVEGKADDKVTKFKMQSGDVVFVPTLEARYGVQGEVSKPAYYPFPEKGEVTVLDALNQAGGQTSTADMSKAGVIRLVDGKYQVMPVNIETMLKKGNLAKNMALQPGDTLYIPPRSTRQGFSGKTYYPRCQHSISWECACNCPMRACVNEPGREARFPGRLVAIEKKSHQTKIMPFGTILASSIIKCS